MLSSEVPNFRYSYRYPPPDLTNPLASLDDLRSIHQFSIFKNGSGEEWDPYKMCDNMDQDYLALTPSTMSSGLEFPRRPRSRTASYYGQSRLSTASTASNLSLRVPQKRRRRFISMVPSTLLSGNTEMSERSSGPSGKDIPRWRVSLRDTGGFFRLSLSELGNASDRRLSVSQRSPGAKASSSSSSSTSLSGFCLASGQTVGGAGAAKRGRHSESQGDSAVHSTCPMIATGTDRSLTANTAKPLSSALSVGPPLSKQQPDRAVSSPSMQTSIAPSDWDFIDRSIVWGDPKDMVPLFTQPFSVVSSPRPASESNILPDIRIDLLNDVACPRDTSPTGSPRSPMQSTSSGVGDSNTAVSSPILAQSHTPHLDHQKSDGDDDDDEREGPNDNTVQFHRTELPTTADLEIAYGLEVISERGNRIRFGTLFREKKTVVIFIRHFWCPSCQDYMSSLGGHAIPDMLNSNDVNLVVIGNGSHAMIRAYRNIFKFPFKIYTDPSLHLYNALGMTMRTYAKGPRSERGDYIKHNFFSGLSMVLKNALTSGIPIWENGGDVQQLGGEFVLGPGLTCTYAHRMHTTRSHAPAMEVLDAAGLPVRAKVYVHRKLSSCISVADEESWMAMRAKGLAKLRLKKEERRYGAFPVSIVV